MFGCDQNIVEIVVDASAIEINFAAQFAALTQVDKSFKLKVFYTSNSYSIYIQFISNLYPIHIQFVRSSCSAIHPPTVLLWSNI